MITHRRLGRLLYPLIAITALGLGVYAIARQGEGGQRLAQAPLNIETNIPPALIMALDDSGSMIWEVLNNTRDGVFSWDYDRVSFYSGSAPNGYGAGANYYFNFPYAGRGDNAIPPIPAFGFSRSPDVNPAYFDPRITYDTWKNYDGSDYVSGGINPQSADVDPRPNGSNLTFDLTRPVEQAANNNYRFFVASGMVLPSGIRVYFSANNAGARCAATPQLPNEVYTGWVTLSQDYRLDESCRVGISYFPSTFYLADPSTLPAAYGYSATPLAVTAPQGGRPETLYRYEIRPENFGSTSAYNAAMQNFANWFSFYRTRREALIGSLTNSLLDVNNMRVGWFRINARDNVTMYNLPTERQSLFSGFYSLGASGSTPTPQAVDWMGQQFQRTDADAPVQLACQRNAGMLFTDGYINGSRVTRGGNVDGTMGSPFADSFSNTMADNAAYYYNNNVRSDLPAGLVPVPQECATLYDASKTLANQSTDWKRLDCQTNPHMNFYGITLGTRGNVYEINAQSTADPYAYPPAWQRPQDLNPAAVDEMWHATINARGEMVNAKNPALITEAMRRILTSVGSGVTPSGAIGLTGARVGSNSLSVVPRYESRNNGTDWFSTLSASDISTNPVTGLLTYTPRWEASSVLPAAGARNIWLRTTSGLSRFDSTNVGSLAALCSNTANGQSRCSEGAIQNELGVSLDQAVSYLRGDQSLEAPGTLRLRTTRLGDIVNSTPVVSSANDDYGYKALMGGAAGVTPDVYGYSAYLTSKRTRNPYVYVGANDGMLHAFNGLTGVEEFAYIPSTALGHMGNLLFPYDASNRDDQIFRHRYYVDGQVSVSDAYWGSGWKTVLVGAAGAGGRSVFALDVSSPGTFGTGSALWELSDAGGSNAVSQNIGHVLGRPVIVPVKRNGNVSWKAIFGNGYGSQSGMATLFVVDLQTGTAQTLTAQETASGLPASNGLGNIVVVDRFTGSSTTKVPDGYADTVYAGDQNGAVWKFDIRDNGASPPTQRTPFFVATDASGNRQAITGGFTASRGASGGVMIYFGTGSYSFEQDGTDDSIQTFYGVLDDEAGGSVNRSNLLQQKILANVTAADGTVSRTVTANIPTSGQKGWYIDLGIASGNTVVRTGERVVGYPTIESGIVFFSTYQPTITSGCSTVGANRLYGLNTLTGAAALVQVRVGSPTGTSPGTGTGGVSLDTGGTAPVKDVAVLSTPRLSPLSPTATAAEQSAALAAQCSMVVQVAGAPPLYLPRPCGRQSWRQVR